MFDYAQKILESHDAPQQIEVLNRAMDNEKQRRHEFRQWVTPNIKAEFINGEVILHSPVKRRHWKITDLFSRLLSIFASFRKLGSVGTEKVMVALTRNDYEPDLVFYSKEKAETFTEEQMLFPAPDFIVEILSKSTAAIDKNLKKQDYAAHGVREYWIVDPVKKQIKQYTLLLSTDKQYNSENIFDIDDTIESRVIKGFTIPVRAIFEEEINIQTLQRLLSTPLDDEN